MSSESNALFYDIGMKCQTDKIYHHGYHRFYANYIDRDISKMLEIGIEGGHSVNLWLEYCPKALIYGLDIKAEFISDRVKIYCGDQSRVSDLEKLVLKTGNDLDLIVDDGSHIPEHQILSFSYLFPYLKEGGTYIIEDIEISYWKQIGLYGYETKYGLNNKNNIINMFSNILHLLNREFVNEEELLEIKSRIDIDHSLIDSISTIIFGQNCIIIKKKEEYEYAYNNRSYRFYNMIK